MRKLQKLWHKFTDQPAFRVVTASGQRSCLMPHRFARSYAREWKGQIVYAPNDLAVMKLKVR